jgi:hypothetical protein
VQQALANTESETEVSATTPPTLWSRTRKWYVFAALTLLNTVVLFLFLNAALWVGIEISHAVKPDRLAGPLGFYGKDAYKAYPGWREQDVKTLLQESWGRGDRWFEYEPFTGYRERPFNGKFMHNVPAGFRLSKDQAPWPPRPDAFNVFVFGGSTTYGYGLPDEQTIASYLSDCAAANHSPVHVAVYNFGRGSYFSSQELLLFQQLLKAGFVPRLAVFIDGLNEFDHPSGEPRFAGNLRRFMAGQAQPADRLDYIPVVAVARRLSERWAKPQAGRVPDFADHATLQSVIDRWLANKKMIESLAGGFGVRTIFVWQPVPVYKYDLNYHYFLHADRNFGVYLRSKYGYAMMEKLRAQGNLGPDTLWLADIQQDKRESLYVDAVHYSAPFSREIAERICSFERESQTASH